MSSARYLMKVALEVDEWMNEYASSAYLNRYIALRIQADDTTPLVEKRHAFSLLMEMAPNNKQK